MKIAFIEPAGKGGMIHYAFQLCRALSASADVTLITEKTYELSELQAPFRVETSIDLWDPKPLGKISANPLAVAGRKLRRVTRAVRYYAEWVRVANLIGRTKPDVVLLGDVRFPFDLFPLMLLRRKARIFADICHNVHPFAAGGKAGGLFDRSGWRRVFYRRIYKLFDAVFVHFERNRKEFVESFAVSPERVAVIVHGNEDIFKDLRDPKITASILRTRLGIPEGEPVVLFWGTLSRYKGTDVLLHAFAEVRKHTKARLVLAGFPFHDFDVPAHKELTRSLGIADAVVWLPEYIPSEHVAAWMELATVAVFPYRDIYQSGAIHVAQTFGVPIVASAIGAMQDVIENEVSGLLVPPEDAAALAAAISRLLTDQALAQRVGRRAAEDAAGPFSWEANAAIILAALQRTAGAKR
jgi:glycosyltransferase involved in cell wall biosynthesis